MFESFVSILSSEDCLEGGEKAYKAHKLFILLSA